MLSNKTSGNRYFVEFAYNGGKYHGWQIQPNAITIQEVLNKALSTLLKQDINMVGAGRTDTGVHASHFVAHFDINEEIMDQKDLVIRMNRFLGSDIRIDRIMKVQNDLHARFSALSRTYNYVVSRKKSPFLNDFSWTIYYQLDFDRICEATKCLKEYTDFTSFARLHADTKTNDCDIREAEWLVKGDYWVFRIKANRFLRNMVRAIVGTLVEVGRDKISLDEFKQIIESKNRSSAGQSAPPQGLFLTHIEYPDDKFKASPGPIFFDLFS